MKIATYEGFGARRGKKKAKKSRAKKSHGGKARTPQALKFKKAISECGKKKLPAGITIHAAQKALGKCVREYYK